MSKIIADCINKSIDRNGDIILTFRVSDSRYKCMAEECSNGKYDISFRRYTGKRTQQQNALFWKLLGLIAKKQDMKVKDVYRQILIDAEIKYTLIEAPLEAEDTLKGKFRFVSLISSSLTEEKKGIFQCFYGTSKMDSSEFSRLIDKAKEYCMELNIPVD